MSGSTAIGFGVVAATTGIMGTGPGQEPDGPGRPVTGIMAPEAIIGTAATGNRCGVLEYNRCGDREDGRRRSPGYNRLGSSEGVGYNSPERGLYIQEARSHTLRALFIFGKKILNPLIK